MARPYANDLRRKFLQANEQGKGTLGELAEQFGVSEGWAKKISARAPSRSSGPRGDMAR
jgi:transposase